MGLLYCPFSHPFGVLYCFIKMTVSVSVQSKPVFGIKRNEIFFKSPDHPYIFWNSFHANVRIQNQMDHWRKAAFSGNPIIYFKDWR